MHDQTYCETCQNYGPRTREEGDAGIDDLRMGTVEVEIVARIDGITRLVRSVSGPIRQPDFLSPAGGARFMVRLAHSLDRAIERLSERVRFTADPQGNGRVGQKPFTIVRSDDLPGLDRLTERSVAVINAPDGSSTANQHDEPAVEQDFDVRFSAAHLRRYGIPEDQCVWCHPSLEVV
jgi:hypothetical protein